MSISIKFQTLPPSGLPEHEQKKAEADFQEIFGGFSPEQVLAETMRQLEEKFNIAKPFLNVIISEPPGVAGPVLAALFKVIGPRSVPQPKNKDKFDVSNLPAELLKLMDWRENFMLILLRKLKAALGKDHLHEIFRHPELLPYIPFLVVLDILPDDLGLRLKLDPAVSVLVNQNHEGDPFLIPEMMDVGAFVERERIIFERVAKEKGVTRNGLFNIFRLLGVRP